MKYQNTKILSLSFIFIFLLLTFFSTQATSSKRNVISDPSWDYSFKLPKGWKFEKSDQGAVLGHNTVPGMIIVYPHTFNSVQQLKAEMQKGLVEETVQLNLSGRLKSVGKRAFTGKYTGYASGEQVRTKTYGTCSPHGGGGVIITALTTPDKFGKSLSGAADYIFKSIKYKKTNNSKLSKHFAGKWVNITTNTTTRMFLHPNGTYFEDYEAAYSGDFDDGTGTDSGNWDAYGSNSGKGKWTVRGNKRKGTLIIRYKNGKVSRGNYQVHVEKGHTYWNEYFFNGNLYTRE